MRNSNRALFSRLKMGASALAMMAVATALIGGRALAQNVADQNVESVTGSGFKASLERALDQKRLATGATDSILAEDIAKFPGTNLRQ